MDTQHIIEMSNVADQAKCKFDMVISQWPASESGDYSSLSDSEEQSYVAINKMIREIDKDFPLNLDMCIATDKDGMTKWVKKANKKAFEQSNLKIRQGVLNLISKEEASRYQDSGSKMLTKRGQEAYEKKKANNALSKPKK